MNTATADGGRALYGSPRRHDDQMVLPPEPVPRARPRHEVDMVVNIGLLLLLGANNFVILYISNIGYVFCHVLALSGFLLLRRDRPGGRDRSRCGMPGFRSPACSPCSTSSWSSTASAIRTWPAYLGFYEFTGLPLFLGLGVLVASVLLYFYRRVVQDKAKITFRDRDVPTMPNEEQMALLREESIAG